MKIIVLAVTLALSFGAQAAQKTWLVIGDSIMSSVPQGQVKDHVLHLIAAERNVIFKNISSPGTALGATNNTGFNKAATGEIIGTLGGMFSAYDGIIVQAGTNDYGRGIPWENMVVSMYRILNHARTMNKKVLVLDPIWRADEGTPNAIGLTLNTYRYLQFLVCTHHYPDICKFAHRTNTVMGTAAGSAMYDTNEVAVAGQLHPNAMGHRKLADWIEKEAAAVGYF